MRKDYYRILEVDPTAPHEEIKRAYRVLARKYHPDSSGSHRPTDKTFHDIQEAYEILSDPERRLAYDSKISQGSRREKVDSYRRTQAQANSQQATTSSDRAWNVLREQSAKTGEAFSEEEAGTGAGMRFSGSTIFRKREEDGGEPKKSMRRSDSFIGRLKDNVFGAFEPKTEDQEGTQEGGSSRRDSTSKILNELRGEKTVEFSINAMESLTGTAREVTLYEENGPRVIRIRIPAGVCAGSSLRVSAPATELHPPQRIRVKVLIEPHPLVEREGLDIVVKLPVTVDEAILGAELQVPTLTGPVKVRIPPGWSDGRRLRVKGRGVEDSETKEKGDLYIKTFIVLPLNPHQSSAGKQAAELFKKLYDGPVRKDIPETLGQR
ncbi:MAG: J domain-containing protein [Bdellovibrionales bacterium]|nr:J domain-containing protein [Bdellovibrionales bacterium]